MLPSEPSLLLNTRVFGNGGLLFDENHDEVLSLLFGARGVLLYTAPVVRLFFVITTVVLALGPPPVSHGFFFSDAQTGDPPRRLRKARSRQMSSLFCFILGQLTGRRHVP